MREGWELKKLGDVCTVIAGQSPKSSFYNQNSDGLPFYQGKKLFGKKFISPPNTWTSKITKEALKDDILMSVRAPVGPINFSVEKICIGRGLAAIRAEETINKDYLFYFLIHNENEITGHTGAVFNSINKKQIEDLRILMPSTLPEQQQIVKTLDKTFKQIDQAKANLEKNLANVKELFQSKLNEVFSQRGEGWEEFEINEICETIIDCVNKTAPSIIEETSFKMIRTTNIRFGKVNLEKVKYVTEETYAIWTRRQKPKRGDLLFTREAPMGEIGMLLSDDDVFLGQRIVSYRIDEKKANSFFILYAFQSTQIQEQVQELGSGATVQHLRVPHTKGFKLLLPSLRKQNEIVNNLTSLKEETGGLETHYQQKLNNLEELKKSILQKAFRGELIFED